MEQHLIRLLLNYKFYNENKAQIYRTIFPSDIAELYDVICDTHDKLKRDLTIAEVKQLYRVEHPTITKAKLDNINYILDNLPTDIAEDVSKEVLKKAWITEAGRQISQIGIDIINGKTASFSKAREILEKIEQGSLSDGDDLQQVTDDLEEILDAIKITTKWSYNIPGLSDIASGLGPGIFKCAFGRVEVGKSAYGVSLAASPGGFCDQGAKVFYYCNEEAAARTKGRAVMAFTGMPLMELSLKIEEAKAVYSKINPLLKFYECKGKHINDIAGHIRKHSPDIVIIDQLDKLEVNGSFAREDERLGELYVRFRDMLTKYDCAGLALSQANADAEGKTVLATTNMALARTSKAAECDVLVGIGKSSLHAENTRILNLIKNKVTGNHTEVVCQLIPEISRYVG
jgi:hypothetical protein